MIDKRPDSQDSIFSKAHHPILVAGLAFAGALVFMLFGTIIEALGIADLNERFPWVTAGSFLLLYGVYNSVFSISSEDLGKYWQKSILSYIALAIGLILAAYLFSSLWITEAGTFRWIFFILTFGYLAFLSIMGLVKQVFTIVKREDERMHGKWDDNE